MKKNQNKATKKSRGGISIGWKLVLYFLGFTAVCLLVTWIFQVILLDTFFERSKRKELTSATQLLSASISSENLEETAKSIARNGDMTILIYTASDGVISKLFGISARDGEALLTDQEIEQYRANASQNGGSYTWVEQRNGFGAPLVPGSFPEKDENGERKEFDFPSELLNRKTESKRLCSVVNLVDEDGNLYFCYLSTGLVPLSATVNTLKTQFLWIGGILLLLSAITVFFLYRRISKPIIRMNESAKQLAKGNYEVDFSSKGYKETRELADTLNYAAKELSKSDQLQKELLANISHDLRTPLTMIRGYGEVMRDLPGENTPENMQVIIDETTRLSELVNDLLDLSKLQSGVLTPKMQVFDLCELLQAVMGRYEALTAHMGYRITLEAEDSALIFADAGMIQQVLYNLINNAINYTGEDQSVSVSLQKAEKAVRVSVTDTGAGIPKEEIENIWNRYYKIDKVHKRATVGTGLGLSIVKNVLDLHHAAYGVNSTAGKGSTFWFELPIAPQSEDQSKS